MPKVKYKRSLPLFIRWIESGSSFGTAFSGGGCGIVRVGWILVDECSTSNEGGGSYYYKQKKRDLIII